MNARRNPQTPARHQHGAVLFLSMIFLVLLTILAITASSTSIMQERMTGGMRNNQLGLMGAESTLRGGEQFLWNLSFATQQPLPPCLPSDTSGDCVYMGTTAGLREPKVQAFRTSHDWLSPASDGARAYDQYLTGLTGDSISANLATQPRFIIEHMGSDLLPFRTGGGLYEKGGTLAGEHHLYRITARSQGGSDAVVRVAESYFATLNLSTTGFNPN